MIKNEINHIIEEINSVEYNEESLIDSFNNIDLYTYDKLLPHLNYNRYIKLLYRLIKLLNLNTINNNQEEARKSIIMFVEVFYIFRKGEVEEAIQIYKQFIIECIKYDEKFLNGSNKELLISWNEIFNTKKFNVREFEKIVFLDTNSTMWKKIFYNSCSIYNNSEIFEQIVDIVKGAHDIVRNDNSAYESIIVDIDILINFFKENDFNSTYYNRILSLICFKYDFLLQKDLNLENVDNYLNELMFIIDNKLFYNGWETHFKVLEMIAKIQFAYNLLNSKKTIKDLYTKILFDYYKYFEPRFSQLGIPYLSSHFNLATINLYSYIFYNKEETIKLVNTSNNKTIDEGVEFREYSALLNIMMYWKSYKIIYYNMTPEDIVNEGVDKYNFIYK